MIKTLPFRKRVHAQYGLLVFLILFFLSGNFAFSQFKTQVEEGIIRLKVTEAFAQQLQNSNSRRKDTNSIVTGITVLDAVNLRYHAHAMERVFKHAGKHEAKHIKYGLHLWYEVRISKDASIETALHEYENISFVQRAEPVYKKEIYDALKQPRFASAHITKLQTTSEGATNDPLLSQQWHYHNTGSHEGASGADIDLFNAWNIERGDRNVVVAIMDTGVDVNHPDLAANIWVNEHEIPSNGLDDDNNGYVDDIHGYDFAMDSGTIIPGDHGTHVAGTVAAVGNNGIGVAGVAGGSGAGDGVKLMSCAIFSEGYFNIAGAFVYAADNGALISQNSWGYATPDVYQQLELDAIDYFIAEAGKDENGQQHGLLDGGLVVFASGNTYAEGRFYPAYYEPVLSVSATNNKDQKPPYSTFAKWVDISAPGGETEFVAERGVLSTLVDGQYGFYDGTSMACPHVAGVAALVLSRFGGSGYTPRMLRHRIEMTGDYIDDLNPAYAGKMGLGRVNAHQALTENMGLPEAIDDLIVTKTEIDKITLTWTAPADPGALKVNYYDVRYATSPITAETFHEAEPALFPATPKISTLVETFTVSGLAPETEYYFAIRSTDFEGNVSVISNIADGITLPAPEIKVTPSSLHAYLQTNQTSVQSFTIANAGRGILRYKLSARNGEQDFLSFSLTEGEIAAGSSTDIEVTFTAQRLFGGTYQQDIVIHHDDPDGGSVLVHALLDVTSNGSPIVQSDRADIHFKSIELGTSVSQMLRLFNAGSEALIVTDIVASHDAFTSNATSFTLPPFQDSVITITFLPDVSGQVESVLSILTNDDATALIIPMTGEALTQAPVTSNPSSLDVSIPRESQATETFRLTNHGNYERSFTVDIVTKGLLYPNEETQTSQKRIAPDSVHDLTVRYEQMKAKLMTLSPEQQQLVKAIVRAKASPIKVAAEPTPMEKHVTGFEDFEPGPIDGQQDWFADPEWTVTTGRADQGQWHLQANSDGKDYSYSFPNVAISPIINTEEREFGQLLDYQKYSHVSMRINLDSARGVLWEVVPQNPYAQLVTARIQFTEHGGIRILSAREEDLYSYYWHTLEETIPRGYFTLAVECRNDESAFNIYFNDRKVFSGYSLATPINNVAFTSTMSVAGRSMAVDDLKLTFGEYVPTHITSIAGTGTISANSSTDIPLLIDATNIRWGTYASDVVVRFDNGQHLTIPVKLSVTGSPAIGLSSYNRMTTMLDKNEERYVDYGLSIMNVGGVPLVYQVENPNNPGWMKIENKTGSIPVRGEEVIKHTLSSIGYKAGFYEDTLRISSNASEVLSVPVILTILEPHAQLASYPRNRITRSIKKGTIGEINFELSNGGDSTLSYFFEKHFQFEEIPSWISMEPTSGRIEKGDPQTVSLTVDATDLEVDTLYFATVIKTNDNYWNAFSGKSVFFTFYIYESQPPVLQELENVTLREGQFRDIILEAYDEDSEHVGVTLINPPPFITLTSAGHGTAKYKVEPPVGSASQDPYLIEAVATDSEGNTDRAYLSILVEPQIVVPVLDAIGYVVIKEKELRDITFTATDDDSEHVTITMVNPPPFVTLKSTEDRSATYSIAPPVGTAHRDEYVMEVLATDSEGNTGHAHFLMLVEPYPGFGHFELNNLRDGSTVVKFENEVQIDRSLRDFNNLVIRATPLEEQPGSIVFLLNGKKTTVNREPYDLKLSRHSSLIYGDFVLRVEGYSKANGKGTLLYAQDIQLSLVNASTISAFQLLDNSGNVIQVLHDGDVIEMPNSGNDCVRIQALASENKVQQMHFDFNNGYTHTDYAEPFLSHGSNCWNPAAGTYTLSATGYWKGSYGIASTISFSIIKSDGANNLKQSGELVEIQEETDDNVLFYIYPVPVKQELNVVLKGTVDRTEHLIILDIHGKPVYEWQKVPGDTSTLTVNTAELSPGFYFIKLIDQDGIERIRKFVKN